MRNFIQQKLREALENRSKFPHEIKSEAYWRSVLKSSPYALKVLGTIMNDQGGFASDAQLTILKRARNGDSEAYSNKN